MSERDNMLARIREALSVAAPQDHYPETESRPSLPTIAAMRGWLPVGTDELEANIELFRNRAADLKAEFQLLNNADEVLRAVRALRDVEGWTKVATHRGELTESVCGRLGLPLCRTDAAYDIRELECCSVSLTECDALIAQTGSVLVTSRSAGGRALSVLPPHHLVLARRTQLLRDLPGAFELLKRKYAPNYPSFISFITGPSRTGDIERILVLGAHGPKKLTILCV